MPKRNTAEFYWSEKLQLYRKRVKDPATGKWHDCWGKTKAITRQKAEAKRAALQDAQRRAEMPFFAEYAAEWYRLHAPQVKAATRTNWRTAINTHICPYLGALPLCDITADDAQAVMAGAAGLSHETQKRILSVMRRILAAAVKVHYISENPADDLKASGAAAEEKIPLNRAQQEALMAALEGTRCEVFCALALWAGLRREEITGLMWDCVELDVPVPCIHVRRACRWEKNAPTVDEILKSSASRRDIPIPGRLTELLRRVKSRAAGSFVVCNAEGGPMSKNVFRRMWGAVEQRSERSVRYTVNGHEYVRELKVGDIAPFTHARIGIDFAVAPHQLRHTYITELILAGANVKTVQYLAGHADVNITLRIYTHLTEHLPANTRSAVLKAFE